MNDKDEMKTEMSVPLAHEQITHAHTNYEPAAPEDDMYRHRDIVRKGGVVQRRESIEQYHLDKISPQRDLTRFQVRVWSPYDERRAALKRNDKELTKRNKTA